MTRTTIGRLAALLILVVLVSSLSAPAVRAAFIAASVSADGLGNVYISYGAFIAKHDAAGNRLWTRQLGDGSAGVAADALGNVYASGTTSGNLGGPNAGRDDAFIAKYDAAGNFQWVRQFGTTADDGSGGVSTDGLGNVYIAGSTSGSLGGPFAGNTDAFIAKYDATGSLQWIRQTGTADYDWSGPVSADGLGNAYISGTTRGSLGGPNMGRDDAFITKYDAAGNLQWTRQFGTANEDAGHSVSADELGNAYISGHMDRRMAGPRDPPLADAFITKYDAAGNLQWTARLFALFDNRSNGVSADGLGNAYASGYSIGPNVPYEPSVTTPFVAKYSGPHYPQWIIRPPNPEDYDGYAFDVSADGVGSVFVSGYSSSHADSYIARYDAAGNLQWTRFGINIPEPVSWVLAALAGAALLRGSRRDSPTLRRRRKAAVATPNVAHSDRATGL
jgi:hypothetical protein